jgi:hypothetical protein
MLDYEKLDGYRYRAAKLSQPTYRHPQQEIFLRWVLGEFGRVKSSKFTTYFLNYKILKCIGRS